MGSQKAAGKRRGVERRGELPASLLFVNACANDLSAPAPGVVMRLAVDIKRQGVGNAEGEEIVSKDAGEVEPGLGTLQGASGRQKETQRGQ